MGDVSLREIYLLNVKKKKKNLIQGGNLSWSLRR